MGVGKGFGIFLAGMFAAGAVVTAIAVRDVRVKRGRLEAERRIAQTGHGPTEYISWGNGPAALVVHGAGGGFDQGRLIAQAYDGDGFRWIAPSRFGYLGSPRPADASTAAQAGAFADLLDHLRAERAVIFAFSGGVPPALQFAQLYPDRTDALALLSSAPFTPYGPATQELPIPDWLYQALFGSDLIYCSLAKMSPGSLEQAFDMQPELRPKLTEEEQRFAVESVEAFLPASQRAAGIANEKAAIDPLAGEYCSTHRISRSEANPECRVFCHASMGTSDTGPLTAHATENNLQKTFDRGPVPSIRKRWVSRTACHDDLPESQFPIELSALLRAKHPTVPLHWRFSDADHHLAPGSAVPTASEKPAHDATLTKALIR
jgi:pimeloyl-ACP methyl ester carboxylesterase